MNLLDKKAIGYANSIIAMINAEINDAASYRLAIDSIFCHVFGHVTKNDQRALSKYNKTSELSKKALLNPTDKRIVEHVVPITIIYFELMSLTEDERKAENIIKIIAKMYKVRRITVEEDLMLIEQAYKTLCLANSIMLNMNFMVILNLDIKRSVYRHNKCINTIYYTRRSEFALDFVIKAVKFRLVCMVINVLCKRYKLRS
ncbi:hypothetical protein [Aliivibrio fischeri]|uniref:hypothetical protein n=1 Tax=Aliivibrio fischeri TaxID=668 RepID=UPI003F773109